MRQAAVRVGLELAVHALRAVDAVARRRPTEDLVVMVSRQHRRTSSDFARVRREIEDRSPATRVVVLNHRSTRNGLVEAARLLVQVRLLAVARAVVVDTYIIPVSVLRPRADRPVVQIWHASGALKRFGLASIGTAEGASPAVARGMRMHEGYTAVLAGGPAAADEFARGFGVPRERVLEIGQPRHDRLADEEYWTGASSRVAEAYPDLDGTRPVVVYAPTMRRGSAVRWRPLADAAAEAGLTLVVCPHPIDAHTRIDGADVIDGSRVTTSDWIAVADHLVTDYSALAFDAAARRVPVWFYTYDIAEYEESPGLFVDPVVDHPAISSTDAATLVGRIRTHASGEAAAKAGAQAEADWARLRDGHCAVHDGRAVERLVDLLGIARAAAVTGAE